MKRFLIIFLLISGLAFGEDSPKQQAVALYKTQNYDSAFEILNSLPSSQKDEDVFILMSNISLEKNDINSAIQYLNKAINKNYQCYRAYYNLGLIFAKKKSYLLAQNNFEYAVKYNKNFAPAYYNLAYCLIQTKDYNSAKKNLIKAYGLNPKNKDYVYNLAYCYKMLNKPKQAQKILKGYESES